MKIIPLTTLTTKNTPAIPIRGAIAKGSAHCKVSVAVPAKGTQVQATSKALAGSEQSMVGVGVGVIK